jgi:hypothetical protein
MHLVSGVCSQKIWQVINNHSIHMTLDWANKKVTVKVWGVDGLIDDQVEHPSSLWVVIGNCTTHSLISLGSEGHVIAHNRHWLVII